MSMTIVDNGSKHIHSLQKLLRGYKPKIISYDDLDYRQIPRGEIVVLSGGHTDPILWHKKEYAKETELVKRHKGPIIGICLGFELIAHIYGSHLHHLNSRRHGETLLEGTGRGVINIPSKVQVYEGHNWSVPKIKRPLRALAYSKDGVEVFKHSRKPIYGLQFHPEESTTNAMMILESILGVVKST